MTTPRFRTFAEFWPYYVGEHKQPLCRGIHYIAAVGVICCLVLWIVTLDWTWLLLVPIFGYGIAWIGHAFVEHNRPATWSYVLWSLRAEFKMFWYGITGRMRDEVERLHGPAASERNE